MIKQVPARSARATCSARAAASTSPAASCRGWPQFFAQSEFRSRFEAKGRMRGYLAAIPTYRIVRPHPETARRRGISAARALS